MDNLNTEVLPDDLNPAVVAAIAKFIGAITGLVPPPANAFPPEWHGHLRSLMQRLAEIDGTNGVSSVAATPEQLNAPAHSIAVLPQEPTDEILSIIGGYPWRYQGSDNKDTMMARYARLHRHLLTGDLYWTQTGGSGE